MSDSEDQQAVTDRLNDRSGYQGCFACGARNPHGLGLIFRQEGDEIVTEYTPEPQFQGFPGVVHGGILATLLDETLSRTATVTGRWMMTGRLEIRYRQAVPLGRPLRVTARTLVARRQMLQATGEVRLAADASVVLAEAQGTFLPVPEDYVRQTIERYPELRSFFTLADGDAG